MPKFVLEKMMLDAFPQGEQEFEVAQSIDFVVSEVRMIIVNIVFCC